MTQLSVLIAWKSGTFHYKISRYEQHYYDDLRTKKRFSKTKCRIVQHMFRHPFLQISGRIAGFVFACQEGFFNHWYWYMIRKTISIFLTRISYDKPAYVTGTVLADFKNALKKRLLPLFDSHALFLLLSSASILFPTQWPKRSGKRAGYRMESPVIPDQELLGHVLLKFPCTQNPRFD